MPTARRRRATIPTELADAAAAARDKLVDAVASTDDALAEKYLMEEEITEAELDVAFAAAVAAAQLYPVACASATANIAVDHLFDVLALTPSPADAPAPTVQDEAEAQLECDPAKPAVAFVFKTLADPFSGHVNVFRVFQGTISSDTQVTVARDGQKERLGQLLTHHGQGEQAVRQARGRRHRRRRQAQGRRHRRHPVRRARPSSVPRHRLPGRRS